MLTILLMDKWFDKLKILNMKSYAKSVMKRRQSSSVFVPSIIWLRKTCSLTIQTYCLSFLNINPRWPITNNLSSISTIEIRCMLLVLANCKAWNYFTYWRFVAVFVSYGTIVVQVEILSYLSMTLQHTHNYQHHSLMPKIC